MLHVKNAEKDVYAYTSFIHTYVSIHTYVYTSSKYVIHFEAFSETKASFLMLLVSHIVWSI